MNNVYRRNIPQSRSHVRLKFVTRLIFINAYDGPAHASNFACEVPPVVSKITPGTRPLYKPWASHWHTLLLERDNIMLAPRSSSVLGFFTYVPPGHLALSRTSTPSGLLGMSFSACVPPSQNFQAQHSDVKWAKESEKCKMAVYILVFGEGL